MLGIIENRTSKMFYNKVLMNQKSILFKNTITGECFISHKSKNELGHEHLLKMVKQSLIVKGKLSLDLATFSWLDYKRLEPEVSTPLVTYLKTQHVYMLLPDRVVECVNINSTRSSNIVLNGVDMDYILKEEADDTRTLENLEQLRHLREGLFKQLNIHKGVLDIHALLNYVNTLGRGTFVCVAVSKKNDNDDEYIVLQDKTKQFVK